MKGRTKKQSTFSRRKNEGILSVAGVISGGVLGACKGTHIGIAFGGPGGAISGTIPGAIVGGLVCGLGGNKIGTEMDFLKGRR